MSMTLTESPTISLTKYRQAFDEVLRDLYMRGKYRDVILPMTVPRRLDAMLEATKEDVMAQKRILDDKGIAHQDSPLRQSRHRKTRPARLEHDTDPALRDAEQILLLEQGGIEAFTQREVLPYAPDAWYVHASVKVGCEINFTRHFYNPDTIRPLEETRAYTLAIEKETEGSRPRSCLQDDHRVIEMPREYIVNEHNSRINVVH